MTIIDADKFLAYLIYSKHIDGLTCGEVKKAIEMCKVDAFDEIRTEILKIRNEHRSRSVDYESISLFAEGLDKALRIIDRHLGKGVNE